MRIRPLRSPVPAWVLALLGDLALLLLLLQVKQPGLEDLHGLGLVLVLGFRSWQVTTSPVGRWVTRTAESVVFTNWPPGPEER